MKFVLVQPSPGGSLVGWCLDLCVSLHEGESHG